MSKYRFLGEINTELLNELEGSHFEMSARQDIVTRIIQSKEPFNDSTFDKYHREMLEFKIKNEMLKAELQAKYVQLYLSEMDSVEWNVDFSTKELILTSKVKLNLPKELFAEI